MRKIAVLLALAVLICCGAAVAQNTASDKLQALVVREQSKNVKKSTGIYAYNCFTDDDLARFRESKRAQKIVEGLKTDPEFKAIVAALADTPERTRAEALAKARKIAMPTYAMVGYVDSSGKSQTDAGRAAQLEIAAAICDAVQASISGGK